MTQGFREEQYEDVNPERVVVAAAAAVADGCCLKGSNTFCLSSSVGIKFWFSIWVLVISLLLHCIQRLFGTRASREGTGLGMFKGRDGHGE